MTRRPTGTIYPLLDRLEREGFVVSRWDLGSARPGPPRRMYELTASGTRWARMKLGRESEVASGNGEV
ncbi:helix-turn-helix transcriptional regulator [Xylanimonas allomyrinae]|uniref:PadR family transcriptional regulator n=1 Tax=Xylanimonas allomyrinae TaxID=2509459 RepID=UPI001B87BBD7